MTAYSPIAQLVEQRTVNPCVPGSSPGWRAIYKEPSSQNDEGFFMVVAFISTDFCLQRLFALMTVILARLWCSFKRFCCMVRVVSIGLVFV